MRNILTLSTIGLLAPLLLAAPTLAADPPGSTPSSPPQPDPNPPPSNLPVPGLPPGPTGFSIERHIPPPQPPDDLTAADAEVDAMIGVHVILTPTGPGPGIGGPQSLAGFGGVVEGLLETDCEWTNDNVAQCIVWDCEPDGTCTEYGDYCVDHNGNDVPCP